MNNQAGIRQTQLGIIVRAIGVFVLYSAVILFSSFFTFEPTSTPLFWPANAIVLVIMLYSTKERAWIYLSSAGLGYFVYLLFYDAFGFIPSLLLTSSNLIEIIAGYILIRKFSSYPIKFTNLRNAVELICYGVILNSAIGASAGTVLMYKVWETPALINWSIWFGTSAIGYLMILPMMISWLSLGRKKEYGSKEILGIILFLVLWAIVSFLIFSAGRNKPFVYPYIVFPGLLFSSIRFDLRITSVLFLVFIIISSICSAQGLGPFAMGEFYREIVLIRFHLFCGITGVTVILVSALGSERDRLVQDLKKAFEQIKALSLLDELTGIANRRKFEEEVNREWKRAFRNQNSLAVIMCDIDHFKKYNDYFGHQEGDDCLRKVAKAIENNIHRAGDIVARFGGEEFIVLLLDCNSEQAFHIAERIRCSVTSLEIKHADKVDFEYITLSLGVASMVPNLKNSFTDLIEKADKALYMAKHQGRNQTVLIKPI